MARRRQINLARELRRPAAPPPPVREHLMPSGVRFAAWLGRSHRRHVFKVQAYDAVDIGFAETCVVAAVRRDGGSPELVAVCVATDAEEFEDWRRDAAEQGADEIHVHGLSAKPWQAEELVEDLGFDPRRSPNFGMGF